MQKFKATDTVVEAGNPRAKSTRRFSARARNEALWGYLMIAPLTLGWLVFFFIALSASLAISMMQWNLLSPPQWIGFENFVRLPSDPLFIKTLKNTVYLVALYVPSSLLLSFLLALALNTRIGFRSFYRMIFFLPLLTMPVASAAVWRWLYHPIYGLVNYGLSVVGAPTPAWLADPNTAMPAIVAMLVWNVAGFNMIIFLAGLQSIPRVYYEAAQIDGARPWQQVRHVTLPLLTPTTFFLMIISIINAFQVFDQVYVMTNGGPADSTRTIVYHIFIEAFQNLRMGYATAMSWVLFLILFALTAVQFLFQKRWVHYK